MEERRHTQLNNDDHTLLMVMDSKLDSLIDTVKDMTEAMKTKVEVVEFKELKDKVEDLNNKKWFMYGISATISFLVTHFFK